MLLIVTFYNFKWKHCSPDPVLGVRTEADNDNIIYIYCFILMKYMWRCSIDSRTKFSVIFWGIHMVARWDYSASNVLSSVSLGVAEPRPLFSPAVLTVCFFGNSLLWPMFSYYIMFLIWLLVYLLTSSVSNSLCILIHLFVLFWCSIWVIALFSWYLWFIFL